MPATARLVAVLALALALVAAPLIAQTSLTPRERRLQGAIAAAREDQIAYLQRVVDIPSSTLNLDGVRRVGAVFRASLDSLGFTATWVTMPDEVRRAGHLVAEHRGRPGAVRMLLIGHFDTVVEPDGPNFVREDSMARGVGSGDMKGGDVIILYALKAIQAAGSLRDLNLTLVFTGDEELAGRPLSVARRDLIEAARRNDVALAFEGGNRSDATVARRGSSAWRLTVTGRQAHSAGVFGQGAGYGAIYELARIINAFREQLAGEEYLTFNVGTVLGGTDVTYDSGVVSGTASGKGNVVPRSAVAHGDLRFISEEQQERTRARMRAIVAQHLPGDGRGDPLPGWVPGDAAHARQRPPPRGLRHRQPRARLRRSECPGPRAPWRGRHLLRGAVHRRARRARHPGQRRPRPRGAGEPERAPDADRARGAPAPSSRRAPGGRVRSSGPDSMRVMLRLLVAVTVSVAPLAAQDVPVVLRAATVLDGRGGAMTSVDIVVQGGRIVRVGPRGAVPAGARIVDLGDRTVLPGLIDAHAHPTWYFNRQGRLHTTRDGDTPVQSMLAAAANAYATLLAGFTTIQSPGSPEDRDLRDWIATQGLPGPRILTSLEPLTDRSGGPDSLRALVRQRQQQGADFIKLFASASIRDGGAQTMTDAQLQAACGEARTLGLRTIVHAHSAEAVRACPWSGRPRSS